jgi:hypothetical protein
MNYYGATHEDRLALKKLMYGNGQIEKLFDVDLAIVEMQIEILHKKKCLFLKRTRAGRKRKREEIALKKSQQEAS